MSNEVNIDINKIMTILPHRYPFLMVDRVVELYENHIVGIKNVSMNEEFFQGHFPGMPVMPGVLQVEALAQTAGLYAPLFDPESAEKNKDKLGLFAAIDGAKFKRPVVPGDRLRLEIEMIKIGRVTSAKGRATVDGELACEADLKFMMVPRPSAD